MQRVYCNIPMLQKAILGAVIPPYGYARQLHRLQLRSSAVLATYHSKGNFSVKATEDDSGKYKIVTIPNALCVARITATPVIGHLVVNQQFTLAFSLFAAAGLTDLLDGYIARNFKGQKSLLGSVLDPIADKLLISVMFITMTHVNLIPVPLTCVVILRDICLIVGGFYKRYKTMEPPYRFFNPEVSSMQIVPTLVSKINTVLQLTVVAASLAGPVFDFGPNFDNGLLGLYWTTAATTIYSGLQYASGRAFKKV